MEPVNIQNIRLYRYQLPLARPITVHGHDTHVRQGLVLEITDNAGHTGYGEIAPLPGLHRESIQDCLDALFPLSQFPNEFTLKGILTGLEQAPHLPPSAAFGRDMARIDLLSKRMKTPLHKLLNADAPDHVHVNALVTHNGPDPIAAIRNLYKNQYFTIKLKVGYSTPQEDAERVNAITKEFGKLFSYRLDANRAWSMDQALEFFKQLKRQSYFEYIEEPLADPFFLTELTAHTSIPLALDESLVDYWNEPVLADWIGALIIKPSVLGPLCRTLDIMDRAGQSNTDLVFTSCFESGLGLDFIARLSAATQPSIHTGLDTWRWLQQDLVKPPFKANMALVDLSQPPLKINLSRLEPVERS